MTDLPGIVMELARCGLAFLAGAVTVTVVTVHRGARRWMIYPAVQRTDRNFTLVVLVSCLVIAYLGVSSYMTSHRTQECGEAYRAALSDSLRTAGQVLADSGRLDAITDARWRALIATITAGGGDSATRQLLDTSRTLDAQWTRVGRDRDAHAGVWDTELPPLC